MCSPAGICGVGNHLWCGLFGRDEKQLVMWMCSLDRKRFGCFFIILRKNTMSLTQKKTWKQIENHAETLRKPISLSIERRVVSTNHLTLDYSAQRLDKTALALLCELAEECHLGEKIDALMTGDCVNQ